MKLNEICPFIDAALAGKRPSPDRPVAVVDGRGHPVMQAREDGAPPLLAHVALAKAFSCTAYGKATGDIRAWAVETPERFVGMSRVAQSAMGLPLIASKSGEQVLDADHRVVGAVGVAGETDEALALSGIAAAGLAGKAPA